ncbi:hypothetical protein Ciccas_010322 [Cichlidogyrus casuarinus]|uniref:C2H2-type domain-containing protein n=1 Tax=Cichlidogyrus casuarinus TaxID=1844966 RepID=A0ABD2PUF7_9PLAT
MKDCFSCVVAAGTKAFTCVTCGKNFSVQQALRKHVIIQHEGGKPYRCSLCKMCFRSRANMTQHRMLHHQTPISQQSIMPSRSLFNPSHGFNARLKSSPNELSFRDQLSINVKKFASFPNFTTTPWFE